MDAQAQAAAAAEAAQAVAAAANMIAHAMNNTMNCSKLEVRDNAADFLCIDGTVTGDQPASWDIKA